MDSLLWVLVGLIAGGIAGYYLGGRRERRNLEAHPTGALIQSVGKLVVADRLAHGMTGHQAVRVRHVRSEPGLPAVGDLPGSEPLKSLVDPDG